MNDLISRQYLIDIFSKNSIFQKITNAEGKSVIDIIQEAPKTTDWIPCKEKLPEEGETVIACNKNGQIETARFYPSEELKGASIWCANDVIFGDIVAWMPLPTPYKE